MAVYKFSFFTIFIVKEIGQRVILFSTSVKSGCRSLSKKLFSYNLNSNSRAGVMQVRVRLKITPY